MGMRVSANGLRIIKAHEGWRSTAYPDPGTGGEPWTIGYGHTSMAGPPIVRPGMKITREEGEQILRNDVRRFEQAVNDAVTVPLNQNQFDALVSFCFNVGPGNFRRSSVLRSVNARRFHEVPRRLALWNKAAGRVLPGLTRRRGEEGELFMRGTQREVAVYSSTDIDVPEGKSAFESTTQLANLAGVGTGVATAFAGLEFRTALVVAAVVLIIGAYIAWERHKKSRDDAI